MELIKTKKMAGKAMLFAGAPGTGKSHVTNLALISPDTRLRVYRDMMPHEIASMEATNPTLCAPGGFAEDNEEHDED